MPEPVRLQVGDMAPAKKQPVAATPPRSAAPKLQKADKVKPANNTPVQSRWPEADAKAMKKAAVGAELSHSDFMLELFREYMRKK